jgi:hypothetical protein
MVAHIDQNKKINGIICDLCGKVFIDKFKYYSAKFDLVESDRSIAKVGPVRVDRRFLDLDLCLDCMEEIKKKVLINIHKRDGGGTWTTKA